MANTTNFGWETPDDTDLVKDGAAAIRTLAGAIDTSLVDLKGGTTGQVLAKNSNTDMDFVWSADAAGMTNPMTTTGDTIYSSSGSTPARLGIGSTGQVLTVAGGVPTWASPAGGGKVLQVVNATYSTQVSNTNGTTFEDTGLTASITPSLATSKILVIVHQTGIMKYNAAIGVKIKLLRGATDLVEFEKTAAQNGVSTATDNVVGGSGTTYLDNPATTSSTTYKTQFARSSANGEALIQGGNSTSTITLMEIGA